MIRIQDTIYAREESEEAQGPAKSRGPRGKYGLADNGRHVYCMHGVG